MAIYTTQTSRFTRLVRADSLAQAVHLIRAIDGFCIRETVRKIGENFNAAYGSALGYDTAANKIDGLNHAALKRVRVASRARTAHGKGAKLPSGLVIHNY